MSLPFGSLSTHESAPHRAAVSANDTVPPTTPGGTNADGYDVVTAALSLDSGALTSVDVTVYYWDDTAGKFTPSGETASFTKEGQLTFTPHGRRFWLFVDNLTGTSPVVSLSVRAASAGRVIEGY